MANTSEEQVVEKVRNGFYGQAFEDMYGLGIFDDPAQAYVLISEAIAAFEKSQLLNQFSSKYDRVKAGKARFTSQEQEGFDLFQGQGTCTACHDITDPVNGQVDLFTDHDFHNIGTPPLPGAVRDRGLAALELEIPDTVPPFINSHEGFIRTPTLRNVALSAPYGRNGVFKSLKEIVHFYNTRDVLDVCVDGSEDPGFGITCWPVADTPETQAAVVMGDLGLNDAQEDAIVAFLKTLTDSGITSLDRLSRYVETETRKHELMN